MMYYDQDAMMTTIEFNNGELTLTTRVPNDKAEEAAKVLATTANQFYVYCKVGAN